MKKKIITLLLSVVPTLFFGQSVFNKFEGIDEITTVIVNKKMFQIMGNMKINDKESQQFLTLAKNLDGLKVFTTSSSKYKTEMKSTVDNYLTTKKLKALMRVSDSIKNVRIYVNSDENSTQVKELLMHIERKEFPESVIVSLIGNFDLNDVSTLIDKMDIPGKKELEEATKKKK